MLQRASARVGSIDRENSRVKFYDAMRVLSLREFDILGAAYIRESLGVRLSNDARDVHPEGVFFGALVAVTSEATCFVIFG